MPVALALLILVAIIGGLVAYFVGSAQQSRARQHYIMMSLAALRAAPPATSIVVSVTQKTIFGNQRTGWFEALRERTFGEAAAGSADFNYLQEQYLTLLRQLREFLSTTFPGSWNPVEPDKPVRLILGQKDAYYHAVTASSLRWLADCATRQQILLAQVASPLTRWDSSLLLTKADSVSPGAPLGAYRYVLETPCTLARLNEEIRRLGGEAPASAGAAAPNVPSVMEPLPPLLHPAAAPTRLEPRAKFMSAWTIWAFVPWLMWIAWVHAGLRARRNIYFCFAIPYAIPLILMIATAPEHERPPDWILAIHGVLWLGGIIHVFGQRKSVNACIAKRMSGPGTGR